MKQKTEHQKGTVENIYQLNGTVPIVKAIPFGLQHILAMFVANIAPILRACVHRRFKSVAA